MSAAEGDGPSGAVTIVIPTYRRPEKLRRAISSVLAQSYKDVHVVVSDNASADATHQIVDELRATDSRVEYFCQPSNVGMIRNINFAYSQVRTPFVGILTDDDFYLPNFLTDAMQAFTRYPEAKISILSAPTVDEAGNQISDQLEHWPKEGLYAPGESILLAVKGLQPVITTCIFRSELAHELHYDEAASAIADIPILVSTLAKYPFHLSKKAGGYFVRHADASGLQFAKSGNVTSICSAFVWVENRLKEDAAIAAELKPEIIRSFANRVDRLFFDLLLVNIMSENREPIRHMQRTIAARKSQISLWRAASLCLRVATLIVPIVIISGTLRLAKRMIRRVRR